MANQVLEVIKSRRSTRAFTDRQVSECDIDNIIDAALYAPSGMNMQTWHFTVVQNTGKLQQLNDLIKGAFAKSDNPHLRERGNSDSYCCYYNAPTLIIVSNTTEQPWAGLDCACAIENMMLASTSLGIGSCWINQLGSTCDDVDVRAFITELGVPSSHEVFGCVALGYAIPDAPRKEKSIKSGLVTIVR